MRTVWTPDLAIGIEGLDLQHQEIFRRVAYFLDAAEHHRRHEVLTNVLAFLERYVVEHFDAEEALMRRHGYSKYIEHREEHAEFLRAFVSFKERFESEGAAPDLIEALGERLCEWLRDHVASTDQAMGRFLRETGAHAHVR